MEIWDSFWSIKKFDPIFKNPPSISYGGTNIEPLASIGMSCFLDASKNKFKDGFSILDYGCGAGILSNFISERLSNFDQIQLNWNTKDQNLICAATCTKHDSGTSFTNQWQREVALN